jgi:hypothetical protein
VAGKLKRNWSPEQIARWLKLAYPDDEAMHVSHETIYRSLYVQARGVLKKELMAHLRFGRLMRQSKTERSQGSRGKITGAISISERPATVEDRAVPGHWEGDLLAGSHNSYIATLVERQTRYVVLVRVRSKHTEEVVSALQREVIKLPKQLRQSLTWDRGKAFGQFIATYDAKYPKAVEVLIKDRERLLTFYDFPAEHWRHLRTTNPIESTFATVRHRTDRTRGVISRDSIVPFVFKLGKVAEQHWRKLNGFEYLAKVITGVRFRDGIEVRDNSPAQTNQVAA